MTASRPTKHVYYSLTEKNPYLPVEYYDYLLDNLDAQMVERMLKGRWLSIGAETIYYSYESAVNFLKDKEYKVKEDNSRFKAYPIRICFDFNIGDGKPLSVVLMVYDPINDRFDIFDEVIIHGIRTETACEEMAARGLLDYNVDYIVHGDATGAARSTNSKKTNYDIIKEFFANYERPDKKGIKFEIQVRPSNPPIRTRHTIVRAYCKNARGKVRLFVWGKAKTVDRGMKLTKLKKGGQFVEDDSKEFQHCTTALGYGVVETIKRLETPEQRTRIL